MSAPLTLAVSLDADDYSRFEAEHRTIAATVTATGSGLAGEAVRVSIYKARRARDVLVKYKTLTLPSAGEGTVTFDIADEVVSDEDVPLMRRGMYYIRAWATFLSGTAAASSTTTVVQWTGGGLVADAHIGRLLLIGDEWRLITDNTTSTLTVDVAFTSAPAATTAMQIITFGDSEDFRVSMFTLEQFKIDRLFGIDLTSESALGVKEQPQVITGVTVQEVSPQHPLAWTTLSYVGPVGETALGGTAAAASTATVVNWTGGGLTVNAWVGYYLTWGDESKVITSNTAGAITVSSAFSAAPATTDALEINHATNKRGLSWCGGPVVPITSAKTSYILRRGKSEKDQAYIKVRVAYASLPVLPGAAEDLLVDALPMTDETLRAYIDRAISQVEDELVQVFLEPTRCVTDIPSDDVVTYSGTDIPTFVDADWDVLVPPLSYRRPVKGYVAFKVPQIPVISFESLTGYIANQPAFTAIPLDWLQVAHVSGWVELLPVSLGGPDTVQGNWWYTWFPSDTIPNMWHYSMLAGFRRTPQVLLDLVQTLAVISILVAVGQSRSAVAGRSLGRDGVTERVDFNTGPQYGIFAAAERSLREWVGENLRRIIGKYRGPQIDAM